ncbi:TPA: site-specific integrase [Aeromonas hydrophila]|uniref:site-specific integrase n=1 Tax=Aeromonas TaxID=642 RepID=UPI000932E919|nr:MULTISPECIES: site-specific integrase [Aeromonas]MCK0187025.1 site-specific integrase [Aeromonas hydrophila]UCM55588.1 site-specific integrase [Aeromonas hydrophila]UOV94167.1 site-specific integrase [Aeromonas hydrophila]BBT06638.1 recombinase [Aeromonas hydrophila]
MNYPHIQSQTQQALQSVFDPQLNSRARRFLRSAKADSTLNAYQADTRIFVFWCQLHGLDPLQTTHHHIMNFLADQADGILADWVWLDKEEGKGELRNGEPRKPATLVRRLAGIRYAFKQKGIHPMPTEHAEIKEMMRGIVRLGDNRKRKTGALTLKPLACVLDEIDTGNLAGLRDYTLLLLMFSGALRRSEAARIEVDDLDFVGQGIRLRLKPSKHQLHETEIALVPGKQYCPVSALARWLKQSRISEGALFRRMNRWGQLMPEPLGPQGINLMIKRRTGQAIDDLQVSGHSLRRGFITSAVTAGKPMNKIIEVTRHKDIRTLQEYFDDAHKFSDHALDGLL